LQWEARRLVAVSLATLGVIAVVYGGTTTSTKNGTTSNFVIKPTAPLLGNLLTLVASFGYGLYQVLYKIYAALPSDPEVVSDGSYQEISGEDGIGDPDPDHDLRSIQEGAVYPPPFGFHPNLLTSVMGFFTFILLWIPIPILHYSGAEIFRLPPNFFTVLAISGIALGGVVFNAGFMASLLIIIPNLYIDGLYVITYIGFVRHLGTNHSLCWESANYSSGSYV
jgi:drug/metabolite transporter (DMT)-like permease